MRVEEIEELAAADGHPCTIEISKTFPGLVFARSRDNWYTFLHNSGEWKIGTADTWREFCHTEDEIVAILRQEPWDDHI